MDIDKLFKVPKLPGGNKRKLPDNPSLEMLKRVKMDTTTHPTSVESTATSLSRMARVDDATEDEDVNMTFAPGDDADYFAEEDEDGRFFGGGLTSEQKEILNIFDKAKGDNEVEEMSLTRIRRLLISFEKAVNRNQEQRSKYPNDPSKFIDSEADLDSAIKLLLPLSQYPAMAYSEIVRSGVIDLLVGLLTHENMDIVIDAVELIYELTDEDAELDQDYEQAQDALNLLVQSLVDRSVLELLVDNLGRLSEEEDSDKEGVFHILGIFENLVGLSQTIATRLGTKTSVIEWLMNRIQKKGHDANRSYAAELLSILLQSSEENRRRFVQHNAVETLLKVLSQFRSRDPIDGDEAEFMENMFDALCSSLTEPSIKKLFLDAEGTDLMILMIKEKLESKSRSIKVLNHAMSGPAGGLICEAFVEALGLKTLFNVLMGKSSKKSKSVEALTSEDTSHTLGIISALLTNLATESTGRIRLLAKFVEGNYEKIDKLLEIRESARKRLRITDARIKNEQKEIPDSEDRESDLTDLQDAFYLQRLDGGLFTLQTVDYILAWLIMEDDGIRHHALRILARGDQSVVDIIGTLKVHEEHMDEGVEEQSDDPPLSQKSILKSLISALSSA